MAFSARLLAFAPLTLVPVLLLSSCGDDATGARTTLGTVQNTSYVVEPPITTTTTTTLPAPSDGSGGQVSPVEQIHIVVAGDSLSKIASMYGISLETLVNYNAWTDGINHVILPGSEVKIPPNSQVPSATTGGSTGSGSGSGTGTGTGTSTGTTEAPAEGVGCTHTVVANDNPTRVANKYGVTLDELNNANVGNPAYTRFLLGDSINIPANGDC